MTRVNLLKGLEKTRKNVLSGIGKLLGMKRLNDCEIDELEETLVTCDISFDIVSDVVEKVKGSASKDEQNLREKIVTIIKGYLPDIKYSFEIKGFPHVILVAGVNGTGKTTTIGKLAYRFRGEGRKILVVAADTFRAAAGEQLKEWAKRAKVDFFGNPDAKDPGSVVYDALNMALSRGYDIVLIDTAGRLHTRVNLMNELEKIKRVCGRVVDGSPHDVWLVLDASFGQNGVIQAEQFMSKTGLTGIILAKMDGTAKGGVAISILKKYGVPICYMGTGESIEDLIEFDIDEYLRAIFGD